MTTQQPAAQFLWKIGGPAGYGIMTTGLSMSKVATRSGWHVFDYAEYPSLIQGGHNTYEVNMSPSPVTASKQQIDCLVCLTADTFVLHQHRLHAHSLLIYDPANGEPETTAIKISVPLSEILNSLKASKIMINMVALGASVAVLGGKLEVVTNMIEQQFGHKKPEVTDMNIKCASAGYQHIVDHFSSLIGPILSSQAQEPYPALVDGNTAFSLGCVAADCRLYAAYPMSPASSVVEILASVQHKTQMVVRHAEDEIGVVNEALGASFAGVRSAVGTSGGGFALMVETISYAGVAEQPLVLFLAQRPGPATGMPTWTEQGDLLFAVHAGHGEFPKIVLAPGDAAEMLELTPKAFNLAEIYQLPVIVLSDKALSECHQNIPQEQVSQLLGTHPVDHGKTISETPVPYLRYQDSEDGISPRLIPGAPDTFYQSNSYEHVPDSHTTEDNAARIVQVNKRARKLTTYLKNHWAGPSVYGDLDAAELVFVGWGGIKGALLAAQTMLAGNGVNTAFIHFTHVYPLSTEQVVPLLTKQKKYLLVENNSTGQFGSLLRMLTGVELTEKLLKYDGRPLFPEEIAAAATNLIR